MENKELHIAFFLATFSAGGAQSVMINLANSIAKKGIKVDFVVVDCSGPFLSRVMPNVNIIDLKAIKMSRSLFSLITYLKLNKPDVLLSTQTHTNVMACLAKVVGKVKTKIILREANTPSVDYKKSSFKEKIGYKIAKTVYPYADFYIGQSNGLTTDFLSFYKLSALKIDTIPNPIISEELFELSEGNCNHSWFQEDVPILISIGRSSAQKDFSTLVKAFSIARKEKKCRLVILGNMDSDNASLYGELKNQIRALKLEKDISFAGFKKNPFPYLKKAQVYILSSIYEGLPGALIQAMALGCNVVSTDCPSGPKEIIERGESGILVPIKDYKGLAKGILFHLNNPTIPNYNLSVYEENNAVNKYLFTFQKVLLNSKIKKPAYNILEKNHD